MSTLPDTSLLLVGLSGTGKTNFLVALDVVLDNQITPDGLVHSDLADDRAYLQPLKEKWLRGEELEHTSRQQPPPPHQLLVKHPSSGRTAGFHLPDLAGETFDAHFVTRSFPKEFADRLSHATGLLLFVHCNSDADHILLESSVFLDPAPAEGAPTPTPVVERPPEWSLEKAARQIKLVDLLQFISEAGPRNNLLRIAVIISAWDVVENLPASASSDIPKDPVRFLSARWPLLDQYLSSHPDVFTYRTFGVSARGGGTTPEEIARLTALDRPTDRILLVDADHRSSDLTRPVRWLLGMMPDSTPSKNG